MDKRPDYIRSSAAYLKAGLTILFFLIVFPVTAQRNAAHRKLRPDKTFAIDKQIPEASGLAYWNGRLYTHNDSGVPKLFALDTASGKIIESYALPGTVNTDWEDLAQDSVYFYLGDTGNNTGARDTLRILRIEKKSLLGRSPKIDSITFCWPEKKLKGRNKKINYDCEALIATADSLYLFTKEWRKKRRTQVFSLPNSPGLYTAKFRSQMKSQVLITGAAYGSGRPTLALCGYNLWLRPFILIFPNSHAPNFLSGKCIKIKLKLPFRQVEGITLKEQEYYFINEQWRFLFLETKSGLHRLKFK